MSVSALNIDKAYEKVREAWRILLKECQSRKWDSRQEVDDLHDLIRATTQLSLKLTKFQTRTFGFEFWREIEKEEREHESKRLANKHCQQLGLELPYPDEGLPSDDDEA